MKIEFNEPKELVNGSSLNNGLYSEYVGKYVIVRSRNEGVNAGEVVRADATGIILKDARRLWYHIPPTGSWYEGVALRGLGDGCKVSAPVEKLIVEDYSVTVCTEEAESSIRGAMEHNA